MRITEEDINDSRMAIVDARGRFPHLGPNGLKAPADAWKPRHYYEVATAIAFLRECGAVRYRAAFSYRLKHQIEDWGAAKELSPYVSNGAAIVAALSLGFRVWPNGELNADMGVSRQSLRLRMEEVHGLHPKRSRRLRRRFRVAV